MFLKRYASHCFAVQNPRTQTPGLLKLCLVKQRKAMTHHLAPKVILYLPQARITTKITKGLPLGFSLQGGGVFFRLKHTSLSKAETFAALPKAAPLSHRSLWARSALKPSRPFPSRHKTVISNPFICLWL